MERTLPALPPPADAEAAPPRPGPLLAERSDFLEGDSPAAEKVEAFLAQAFAATGSASPAQALVPWICDALLSNHSVKAYGQDLMDFVRHMRALLDTGLKPTTVPRRRLVLRGRYQQLGAKGLAGQEMAQDIAAGKGPGVQKGLSFLSLNVSCISEIPKYTTRSLRTHAFADYPNNAPPQSRGRGRVPPGCGAH